MSQPDVLLAALAIASLTLTLALAWRTAELATLDPECDALEERTGAATDLALQRRFYGTWWLEFGLDGQRLRVEPGPWLARAMQRLRREPTARVSSCADDSASPRVWSLWQGEEAILTVAEQRAHARETARVTGVSALLTGTTAGLLGLALRGRRRAG